MSKNRRSEKGGSSSKDNLRWTPEMDTVLLDALQEEVHKGNRPDGTFTSYAYSTVLQTLKAAIGPFLQKTHIKNRMKTLKVTFNECYDLFHMWSGVGWNPTTRLFEAEPEVWEEIIRDKPEAQKWRRTPINNYDKLLDLFSKDRATGAQAESARDKVQRWGRENFDLNDGFDGMSESDLRWGNETPISTGNMDTYSPVGGGSNQSQGNQSQGTSSSKGSKRKAALIDVIKSGYEKMHLGINNLTEVMREGVAAANRHADIAKEGISIIKKSRPQHHSPEDVWSELEKIGVMPELRVRCYHFLCSNEEAKQQFFGVPDEMRWNLLLDLMKDAGLF